MTAADRPDTDALARDLANWLRWQYGGLIDRHGLDGGDDPAEWCRQILEVGK